MMYLPSVKELINDVIKLVKLLLNLTATNATSEITICALRYIKTYLHTTAQPSNDQINLQGLI